MHTHTWHAQLCRVQKVEMWCYLGSFRPGEYRTYWRDGRRHSASDRVRPTLPTPPWLCALLEQSQEGRAALNSAQGGCRYDDFLGRAADRGIAIHALVRVSPGQALGSVFAVHNREDELLMQFMGWPADAYSLRIEAVQPIHVATQVFSQEDGRPVSLSRSCFVPGGELRHQCGEDGRLQLVQAVQMDCQHYVPVLQRFLITVDIFEDTIRLARTAYTRLTCLHGAPDRGRLHGRLHAGTRDPPPLPPGLAHRV